MGPPLAAALVALCAAAAAATDPSPRSCEPIRVEMCKNIGYNATGMPNLARHAMQADADVTVQTFSPLLQYGCSSQLHLFLCSVYVPMCTDKVALPIGPCRGLCESVRARCFPILRGFGFPWPAEFDCSRFPAENNRDHMCMEGPGEAAGGPSNAPPASTAPIAVGPGFRSECRGYAKPASYAYLDRSGRCARFCDAEVLHDASERRLAEVWLSVWALLCFAATLAAVLTFLAGAARGGAAPPAERPLAVLALCHNLAAVGWGVRVVAGHAAVACTRDAQSPQRSLLSQDGLSNPNCAVVFLLLYYFGTAAAVWWVALVGSWRARVVRRAAGSGAGGSRAGRRGPPLQLAAWGIPAVQTVAVLVLRDVDADELTGTCFVGNQSTRSLMTWVIAPQLTYLLVGVGLLATGFRALLGSPAPSLPAVRPAGGPHARRDPSEDASLLRLGMFAVVYAVPAVCVLASWFYEYFSRDSWLAAPKPSPTPSVAPRPAVWVFLLRILMLQILGVLTSAWMMSPGALRSWKCVLGKAGPPTYKPAPVECAAPAPVRYCAPPQIRSAPKRSHSHGKHPVHARGTHGKHQQPRTHRARPTAPPGGETVL